MTDAHRLPKMFKLWQRKAADLVRRLESQGATVVKAHVDPDAFVGWCAVRGIEPDAQARIRFANEAAFEAHGKTH